MSYAVAATAQAAPLSANGTFTIGLVSVRGLDSLPFVRRFKLDQFVATLNALQSSFEFISEDAHWELGEYDATHLYSNERYFKELRTIKKRRNWNVAIAITAAELEHGVFNKHLEAEAIGVITANRFREYLPPGATLYRYLAYLVICETLCLTASQQFEHPEYKLCLFDMCVEKSDLKDCLATPSIHEDCVIRLRAAGFEEKHIDDAYQILGYVGTSSLTQLALRGVSEPGSGFLLGVLTALVTGIVITVSMSVALIMAAGVLLGFITVLWFKAVHGRPRRPKRAGKLKRWRLRFSPQ